MNKFQNDQVQGNGHDRDDPQDQKDHLGADAEHENQEDQRQQQNHQKSPARPLRIVSLKAFFLFIDHFPKSVLSGQNFHGGGQGKPLPGHAFLFTDHQARLLQLCVEHPVQVQHQRPDAQPDEKCHRKEQGQNAHVLPIIAVIHAEGRFPHGVDPIGEREQRVKPLEKVRRHLDGIGSRRARYLQDHKEDAERFPYVLKGNGQGIDQVDIDKGYQQSRPQESRCVFALGPQKANVADADDQSLHQPYGDEQKPPAEVCLCGRQVPPPQPFILIHLHAEDGDEDDAADPYGEIGIKRRHSRSIVFHRVQAFRGQVHRRRDEAGHLRLVDPLSVQQLRQASIAGRAFKGEKVCLCLFQSLIHLVQGTFHLFHGGFHPPQTGLDLIQNSVHLLYGRADSGQRSCQSARVKGYGIQTFVQPWQNSGLIVLFHLRQISLAGLHGL